MRHQQLRVEVGVEVAAKKRYSVILYGARPFLVKAVVTEGSRNATVSFVFNEYANPYAEQFMERLRSVATRLLGLKLRPRLVLAYLRNDVAVTVRVPPTRVAELLRVAGRLVAEVVESARRRAEAAAAAAA